MNTPITGESLIARGFKKTFVGDFTKHPDHQEYYLELSEYEQDERDTLGIVVKRTNGSDIRYWWISFYRTSSGGGRNVSLKAVLSMEQLEAFLAWFSEDN
jgi:hypothetical protein